MTTAPTPLPNGAGLSVAAVGVGAAVIVLAVIFVALRFYTRLFTRVGLWWDDWLILAAVVATSMTAALVLAGNQLDPYGDWASAGTDPNYQFTPADTLYMKLSYASSIIYFTSAGATKLGILLMYVRIFYMSDGFRTQVVAASVIVMAYWIATTLATLLTCRPMSYIWSTATGYPRYCFNFNVFWMATGICEILLDLMILALPVRAVARIKLSRRRKLSVIGIFMLGGFVIITGLVRICLAYNPGGHIPMPGPAEVCATLHAGLAIVCSCLPILKPLLSRLTGSPASTRASNSTYDPPSRGAPDHRNIIHLSVRNCTSEGSLCSNEPEFSTRIECKV